MVSFKIEVEIVTMKPISLRIREKNLVLELLCEDKILARERESLVKYKRVIL